MKLLEMKFLQESNWKGTFGSDFSEFLDRILVLRSFGKRKWVENHQFYRSTFQMTSINRYLPLKKLFSYTRIENCSNFPTHFAFKKVFSKNPQRTSKKIQFLSLLKILLINSKYQNLRSTLPNIHKHKHPIIFKKEAKEKDFPKHFNYNPLMIIWEFLKNGERNGKVVVKKKLLKDFSFALNGKDLRGSFVSCEWSFFGRAIWISVRQRLLRHPLFCKGAFMRNYQINSRLSSLSY